MVRLQAVAPYSPCLASVMGPTFHSMRPEIYRWDRQAARGLSYVVADRGQSTVWLYKIGRVVHPRCECGTDQNSVHLRECRLVGYEGDGEWRKYGRSRSGAER